MTQADRHLIISDLQIPFEAAHALKFCLAVQKEFRIPKENILNVGDEIDCYAASRFPKDPDRRHSAVEEVRDSIGRIKDWYRAFPTMRLCISNHGMRWAKKAFDAEIPSQMLKPYRDIIEAPAGWRWSYEWVFKTKHPFRMVHGVGYSGMNGARTAAVDAGMSTVIGHLHSHAGVAYVNTANRSLWGFNVGCLINADDYAFSYAKDSRFKACLGVGVVIDSGLTPLFIPYERFI